MTRAGLAGRGWVMAPSVAQVGVCRKMGFGVMMGRKSADQLGGQSGKAGYEIRQLKGAVITEWNCRLREEGELPMITTP